MSKLNELAELGQSVWLDFIRREYITKGDLQKLIDDGLRGITSNPAIFEKAIAHNSDYDHDIRAVMHDGYTVHEIFEKLAIKDIDLATDAMMPVYEKTKGLDGYVSLEVSPKLAKETEGTIEEGKRLFTTLGKPNVMIKVPATEEGIPAISELIGSGINVNVTLIFSLENYKEVVEAYILGLEKYAETSEDLSSISSVASFFVSRVDSAVDKELDAIGNTELKGKIAIANAKAAVEIFNDLFGSERWARLEAKGARKQRLLWASTGTKNPEYSDVLYVDELIGPDSVNTIPPATLDNFIDHGKIETTINVGLDIAKEQLLQLGKLGVDINKITDKLQLDGVKLFADAFDSLLDSLEEKIEKLKNQSGNFKMFLGDYEDKIKNTLVEMKEEKILERIWKRDHTVWNEDPTEISNRLGWLDSPEVVSKSIKEINNFVEEIRKDGFTHALLLGMGGSSLAPEVFRLTFGVKEGFLDLSILDSTHPAAVLEKAKLFDPSKTLYIVSTKSGGTIETLSFMKYFYNETLKKVGAEKVARHFIAITDPGSGLEDLAKSLNFRKIFINDPNIGGRYSALSLFGIVPAALLGVDVSRILNESGMMACHSEGENCPVSGDNTPAKLGAVLGALAAENIDKVTIITSEAISSFGGWVEQLIAESTGKNGKGILPVDLEKVLTSDRYSKDRLFVYIKLKDDSSKDAQIEELKNNGFPIVEIIFDNNYDIGAEFFRWEMATVLAGWKMGIQPFDQPNVESAKIVAREMMKAYEQKGELPKLDVSFEDSKMKIISDSKADSAKDIFDQFFSHFIEGNGQPRSYIALQAYVNPTLEVDAQFQKLRDTLQAKYKCATTFGYGPRFLHSTGQLHKGDAGNGLFIQFTDEPNVDTSIPRAAGSDESDFSFGVLVKAQALGDRKALLDNNRNVLRITFKENISGGIAELVSLIG